MRFNYTARDKAPSKREAEPHSLVNAGRRCATACGLRALRLAHVPGGPDREGPVDRHALRPAHASHPGRGQLRPAEPAQLPVALRGARDRARAGRDAEGPPLARRHHARSTTRAARSAPTTITSTGWRCGSRCSPSPTRSTARPSWSSGAPPGRDRDRARRQRPGRSNRLSRRRARPLNAGRGTCRPCGPAAPNSLEAGADPVPVAASISTPSDRSSISSTPRPRPSLSGCEAMPTPSSGDHDLEHRVGDLGVHAHPARRRALRIGVHRAVGDGLGHHHQDGVAVHRPPRAARRCTAWRATGALSGTAGRSRSSRG